MKPARIHIHKFALTSLVGDTAAFANACLRRWLCALCRARAWPACRDCGAHLASLRRTQAGVFTLAQSLTVEEIKSLSPCGAGSSPAAPAHAAAGHAFRRSSTSRPLAAFAMAFR